MPKSKEEIANDAKLKELQDKLTASEKAEKEATAKLAKTEKEKEQLQSDLDAVAKENKTLNDDLAVKDSIIGDQTKELASFVEGVNNLQDANVAEVSAPKEKLTKVKFLKSHSFSMGMKTINAVKGDEHKVDIFTANKLASRGIAIVLN